MAPTESTATSAGALTKRSVVSCFIFKLDGQGNAEVALFRRSDKVRTYQHLLAPISGSIDKDDPSPLSAAWRELAEETTLTRRHLELLRQGKPYTFTDDEARRQWTVHPFAFRLRSAGDADAIVIDWEHQDWGWHEPGGLIRDPESQAKGVPRLAESLRRVWFEPDMGHDAGVALSRGLERLRTDYQSGARQLAGEALRVLVEVVASLPDGNGDGDGDAPTPTWWNRVRYAAWHLWKNGRESMGAAILSVAIQALGSMETTLNTIKERNEGSSDSSTSWRGAMLEGLNKLLSSREGGGGGGSAVASEFINFLTGKFGRERLADPAQRPISILTLSDSSTISQSLQHAMAKTGMSLDLRVLESRPLFEGISLAAAVAEKVAASEAAQGGEDTPPAAAGHHEASTLSKRRKEIMSRLSITIFADAAAAMAAEGVDLVLIGADLISASGAVSNKTGSLPAILSARHVCAEGSVAVVALSESDKVAPPGDMKEHVVEDNGPAQMFGAWEVGRNGDQMRHAAGMVLFKLATAGGGNEEGAGGHGSTWGKATRTEAAAGLDGISMAVRNVSFEWVPPGLVDVYVCERGVWTVEDIAKRSDELAAEVERLFSDL